MARGTVHAEDLIWESQLLVSLRYCAYEVLSHDFTYMCSIIQHTVHNYFSDDEPDNIYNNRDNYNVTGM